MVLPSPLRPGLASCILLFASLAQAQNASVVGCVEVGCPEVEGTTQNNCTVSGTSFVSVGFAEIDLGDEGPSGFSWTQGWGGAILNRTHFNRHKTFYLGAPPETNIDFPACAIFLPQIEDVEATDDAEGTCARVLSQSCIGSLVQQATRINVTGSEDVCEALQSELEENLDESCRRQAGGDQWKGIVVKAIYGDDAPSPISETQNSTSNCWPVLPRENSLTKIDSETRFFENGKEMGTEFDNVTPILTAFYPEDGDATAQVTCMKSIHMSQSASDNKNSGGGESSGVASVPSMTLSLWLASLGLWNVLS